MKPLIYSKSLPTISAYLPIIYFLLAFLIINLFYSDNLQSDEPTYLNYGKSILSGRYTSSENPNFWVGPGYPLILAPIIYLFDDARWIATHLNALFIAISLFLMKRLFCCKKSLKTALVYSLIFGLYFPAYQEIIWMMTEPFCIFLVSLFLFLSFKNINNKSWINGIFLGLVLGYISWVKVIFGFVLIPFSLIMLVICWKKAGTQKFSIAIAVAWLMALSYLFYTFSFTKKAFFWGNSGGENLYWMSTPYENEYGNWINSQFFTLESFKQNNSVYDHHKTFIFKALSEKNHLKRNELFISKAIENIQKYPIKYVKNIMSNFGRIWFNYPLTESKQSPNNLLRIIPNSILFTFLLMALIWWIKNLKTMDLPMIWVVSLALIYFGISLLLSALPRQLSIIFPINLYLIFEHQSSIKKNQIN